MPLVYFRLRPYDKAKGQVLRQWTALTPSGPKTLKAGVWEKMEVENEAQEDALDELAKLRSEPGNMSSPLACDVCTPEQAAAIKQREEYGEVEQVQPPRKPATGPMVFNSVPAREMNQPTPRHELDVVAARVAHEEAEADKEASKDASRRGPRRPTRRGK